MEWRIERTGRAWEGNEAMQRWELIPEKLEMIRGRLLWDEESRIALLLPFCAEAGRAVPRPATTLPERRSPSP